MAEWRRVGESNVEVSDDGRVRRDGVEFVPCLNDNGYRMIRLNGKTVRLHRLIAIAFIPNPLNKTCVDHANGDKTDNRVSNLRWCSKMENGRNCKSHAKKSDLPRGVRMCGSKFHARINIDGKQHYLGTYDSAEEASEVYEATAAELFGEFYRPV